MKTRRITVTRLSRALRVGVALSITIFAGSAFQAQSSEQSSTASPVSTEDSAKIAPWSKAFLLDAAQANKTEIALTDVALAKSQNTAVKAMAQTLRADLLQSYTQVQTLADTYRVNVDISLSGVNRRAVSRLEKASDADFDKEYTTTMIREDVACIRTFNDAVEQVAEPDVRQYAENTLPALRTHLWRSEETARSVGVDDATISSIMKGLSPDEPERGVSLNK